LNAAEIVYTKLLLEKRSDESPLGLRLLARIEAAWRARQAERERNLTAKAENEPIED